MRIWIVLPAFNEAENLPAIFDELHRVAEDTYNLDLRVIVVDDASTDDTVSVARSLSNGLPVDVLENKVNQGLAATFMHGMVAAAKRAADGEIIVCMDADNSHLPGQILQMVRNIQEGRDVVIASRYQYGAVVRGVPLPRRILSWGMSFLFRIIYPIPGVRDYSCGYRAYRASFLHKALQAQGERLFAKEGFACMVGIILRLHKQKAICGEVPIVLRYDQKVGASKMKIGATIIRTMGVLVRERLSRN